MLYDPGGTCTVLAYRPAHYCLRPKVEYRLPLVVLSRLNRFTLSHYGSRTPLSTLHAGLTASHARLSTGCLLGFAGSGLSPDYTIHAELAHNLRTLGAIAPSNFRTLKPQRGLSLRAPTSPAGTVSQPIGKPFNGQAKGLLWLTWRSYAGPPQYYIPPEGGALNPSGRRQPVPDRTLAAQGRKARRLAQPSRP